MEIDDYDFLVFTRDSHEDSIEICAQDYDVWLTQKAIGCKKQDWTKNIITIICLLLLTFPTHISWHRFKQNLIELCMCLW